MASVNKVILVGNLGRDPELRNLPSGIQVANVALATSYKGKDKATGEVKETTEWHRVTFFDKLAEIVGQYLHKGSSVYVEGRLQTRKYTDKDGVEKYATEIVAENMQMLGGRDAAGAAPPPAARAQPAPRPAARPDVAFPDDDVPFIYSLNGVADLAGHSKALLRARAGRQHEDCA